MSYGEIIKKIRRDFNMTLIEFAKKVDVSKSHIHRLENEFSTKGKDKLSPPLDLLHQICEKTGYPFRQFLEEAGYIKPVPKSEIQELFDNLSPQNQEYIRMQFSMILQNQESSQKINT